MLSGHFSAAYDGDGLRAMKQGTLPGGTSAITTYFLYGPDGMPIVEEGWNGTAASVTAANGMGAAGWRERYAGSQKTAYADDPSGSVLARVTAGDTTSPADSYCFYDGYGDVRGYVQVSTGQRLVVRDPVGFGSQYGYYTDPETGNGTTAPGLLCLTHRYYDPGTGRFVTRDPSGYGGGVNLYGFAGDNPVNENDPSGFRPLTAQDISRFAKLRAYANSSDHGNANTGDVAPLINGTIMGLKQQIATVSGSSDPVNLKSVWWAIDHLGDVNYGAGGTLSSASHFSYLVTKDKPFSKGIPGLSKCNIFVADAYGLGGGVGFGGSGVPVSGGILGINQSPPSANQLGNMNVAVAHFLVAWPPLPGDIVAFNSPGGHGHSTIWLGNNVLIYAGGGDVKLGSLGFVQKYEGGTAGVWRRYAP
jgi:RHS repeat-associated protein